MRYWTMPQKLKMLFTKKPAKDTRAIEFKSRGDKHLSLNEVNNAADCYRQAVLIEPEFVDAYVGLGFVLTELQQHDEAEIALTRALSINPSIADVHFLLGTISRFRGDLTKSIEYFSKALELQEDLVFAYRNLFNVFLQCEQTENAKALIKKALTVFPDSAEFHFLLGKLLLNSSDFEPAIACLNKAIVLEPNAIAACIVLGGTYLDLKRFPLAVEVYEKLIALNPSLIDAHLGLADAYNGIGEVDKAINCYKKEILINSESVRAHLHLGNALLTKADTEGALTCYRRVLELQPNNPVAHLISAFSGTTSEAAPDEYVSQLFDGYAENFDSHLVDALHYKVPNILFELVNELTNKPVLPWVILDLGCGTGLSGLPFAPYAKEMVGVDLSSKMLEKASARNIYSRVCHSDLLSMMQKESASSYDIVLAADVFVYKGILDELVRESSRLLRPNGLFAFSVESLEAVVDNVTATSEESDYRLNPTGRYAHSLAYLTRMASNNGFEILNTITAQSRINEGKVVLGHITIWRRTI